MRKLFQSFGFQTSQVDHHFQVTIPIDKNSDVIISEHFEHTSDRAEAFFASSGQEKARLSRHIWERIAQATKYEFNRRLKESNQAASTWKDGRHQIPRSLGKELLLLVWAVEECLDVEQINIGIQNWAGLAPEERWWLFTMANAASNNSVGEIRGWRKAISIALTDTPTSVPMQIHIPASELNKDRIM